MKLFVFILFTGLSVLSCVGPNNKTDHKSLAPSKDIADASEGYQLMKKYCYSCHSPESSSHDAIIAPPMAAVKMRYSMAFPNEEDFVKAMVSWSMDPKENQSLMRGAVNRFKVMPKQPFEKAEIQTIASYIYQNELEEPHWFAAHEKEMHGRMGGMGPGKPQ